MIDPESVEYARHILFSLTPIALFVGYLHGLTFMGPHAIVGLSSVRENRTFAGLALQDKLESEKVEPRCALYVIDTRSGDIVHWLRIEGVVSELYDVLALPGISRPSITGYQGTEVRCTVSAEG